ncbi:DUF3971 domain-containing protein [Mesorhizobium sp. CAU 1741]|uniref:YhdP family protein n=1 Tax=Mesorhizobium sp. CAU 1741 TaxID=3140366 RepID=UPI00325BF3FE
MHSEVPPHEKIRFRRGEITALDQFPSALGTGPAVRPRRRPGRLVMRVAGAVVALVLVAVLCVGALVAGIGDERLRVEAQAAVATLAGKAFQARIGGTNLSLAGVRMLAMEVSDVTLQSSQTQSQAVSIGSAHFGLRFIPLLYGDMQLGRIVLEDVDIALASLPPRPNGERLAIFDENGLVNPDAVLSVTMAGAGALVATLGERTIDRIDLRNIEIHLTKNADGPSLVVTEARLRRDSNERILLQAEVELAGRTSIVEGEVATEAASATVRTLTLEIDTPALENVDITQEGHRFGSASLRLVASGAAGSRRVDLSAHIDDVDIDMRKGGRIVSDAELRASVTEGSNKIEFDRLAITSGRSDWSFHGAFGPAPDAADGYRFEMVSDGSTIAPAGSPEAPLTAVARIAGHLDASGRRLQAEEIGLRAANGELTGTMTMRFEPGKVPGIEMRLETGSMSVGQAKQLWPWFAARGARNWVVANVYGGRVEEGVLEFDIPPGRIGDGVPLDEEEMTGRFSIRGTRFDIAGHIPPVRDGDGSVRLNGQQIDIALESGTVFMPGGRIVNASNGTLKIEDARRRPVIGKLKIDVAGEADDVLQLASYDPIDVGRFIDLDPDDLSGDVEGTVVADIPLQRGIPIESLDWRVDLSYRDLAIARPFEGQMVSAATGTIALDPKKAVIDADARLNGAPSTLNLVEPLGRSDVARQREIAIQMDDKARGEIAPGLDALLSGPITVELQETEGEARNVEASLERALLTIPWVGWSKGSGVPATVAFDMQTQGGRTDLSEFRLSGDTFGATGALALVDGAVSTISFPSARLNRGDDFSFDMATSGGGYAITIRGKSVDARSVVKLYAGNAEGGTDEGGARRVTVDLAVDTMRGFHDEVLNNVKLTYSGTGARTDALNFSATTSSGQLVTFSDSGDGNTRTVTLQSADSGALLRFLDIYEHMQGGSIALTLSGSNGGPLSGQVAARDFWIVNEPRLRSLVSSPSPGDGRSLNQAVRGEIDTTRVHFENAFSLIEKGDGYLDLARGVLRGPVIGSTFQGRLFDGDGNMDMTGTFMPAYGLNRLFGEIPLIGDILGNGRDRGLIGITFRLAGKSSEPQLQVNPLSVIAPGIFRSVFEYR